MREWSKRHPRLSAIGGVVMFLVTGLATLQGIWSLFTNEPFFPYISANIPFWLRILLLIVFGVIAVFCVVLVVRIFRQTGKALQKSTDIRDSKCTELIGILTEMHKQMMYLKTVRLKQRFDKKRFEDAAPLFFDNLGLIRMNDWDDFEKKVVKRIRRRIPKSPEKRMRSGWQYKVTREAKEIVRELVDSKEWQIEDAVRASEHLDSLHIGLRELRDKDEKWQELFEKTKPYMIDPILRELIDKHISCSYAFCSSLLEISYGSRLPHSSFSQLLYTALVGSGVSPNKIEIALCEILEQVEDRLKVFKQGKSFDGEVTEAIRLKLDLGKLLLDGKEILVDLEKMNAQLDSIGAVSAELKFEMWYKDASKTLQNTNYDRLWFENKEGLDYRKAKKSDYVEACKYGLDRLEYIKQLIFDKEGSQT